MCETRSLLSLTNDSALSECGYRLSIIDQKAAGHCPLWLLPRGVGDKTIYTRERKGGREREEGVRG